MRADGGMARLAVEMLTKASELRRRRKIAIYLEQQNRARQAIEKTILEAGAGAGSPEQ